MELVEACSIEDIDRILELIPYIDVTFDSNFCMRWAICKGHFEVVELLLNYTNPSFGYNFPIRIASYLGYTEIVRLLLNDKRVNPGDLYNTAIRWACNKGNVPVIKLLLLDPRVDATGCNSEDIEIKELLAQWKYHPLRN